MRKPQAALLLVAASGLALGSVTVAALPASAATCNIEVTQLVAEELQDNDPRDEIKFKLGDDMHGVYHFNEGTVRNVSLGSPSESFNGSVPFTLYEVDGVVRNTITSRVFSCVAGTRTTELSNGDGIYDMTYRVTT